MKQKSDLLLLWDVNVRYMCNYMLSNNAWHDVRVAPLRASLLSFESYASAHDNPQLTECSGESRATLKTSHHRHRSVRERG
jgi:hypothetical protein